MTSIEGPLAFDKHGNFLDKYRRVVQLKGVNIDGGCKFPQTPYLPSYAPLKGEDPIFFDGDNVSFVGRPWPLEDVEYHINRLKSMGFNTLRYIITWEAIEHAGPGNYDLEFIDYTIEVLKIIDRVGGVFVYLDPHQDVWSRFSGGDGAPMWTLYAAGFDPRNIQATEGAVLENHYPERSEDYHKMIWPTNYLRLVAGTMFVLFFAGKIYAPKAIINGVNIQDFLQDHYIKAFNYLLKRIKQKAPEVLNRTVLGIETLNEPNAGYLGYPDITKHPDTQELRLGTCPTLLDSLKLGVGVKSTVDEYRISITGPRKIGTAVIDPRGKSVWISTDEYDKKYGFKRDDQWILGECLWAQHGVWDSNSLQPIKSDYFAVNQINGDPVDEKYYINTFFIDHYRKFKAAMREALPDTIMFLQPPPLELPPDLKRSELIDSRTIFCPHYYDGFSLLFKTWNRIYNVNTLGIMRHRYINPVFSVILGEGNIRRSIRNQLAEMKQECKDHVGEDIPVLFSEIGMPFDMDDKKAYKDGDFSSQTSALDALAYALEGSNLSHTWWCYTADNSHEHGDGFNREDFSFWSRDDDDNFLTSDGKELKEFDTRTLHKPEYTTSTFEVDSSPGSSSSNDNSIAFNSYPQATRIADYCKRGDFRARTSQANEFEDKDDPSEPALIHKDTYDGLRATDAIVRPYCLAINGYFNTAEYDLTSNQYILKINGNYDKPHLSTKIYLPEWHYEQDHTLIEITSGYFKIHPHTETLEWFHEGGEQTLILKDLKSHGNGSRGKSHPLLSYLLPCCF